MSDFKSRLLEERDQLRERAEKLDVFMDTEAFQEISEVQQDLLSEQIEYMWDYLACLNARIDDLEEN